jgi:type VI protein secretion system component Hcp
MIMNTQPENKDKVEQKVSKNELSDKELEKASGGKVNMSGLFVQKHLDKASPKLG